MTFRLILALVLYSFSSVALTQSIAFSFDDGFKPDEQPLAAQWNAEILDSLAKHKISALFFATGRRVDSPQGLALVSEWGQQGHTIANHSYRHFALGADTESLNAFITDVERNEKLLEKLKGWTKRFRFPYLKEGRSLETRDGFRQWLKHNNYHSGAVSIDASDWYYNKRYLSWVKQHPKQDTEAYKRAYLDHLWDRARYYDGLSKRLYKRSSDHVMLLHTNAINARFLNDIIVMFKERGWSIIGPEQAYQDPIYSKAPNVLPAGESILWSLAKENKLEGLRYPAEDGVYEKLILDRLGL